MHSQIYSGLSLIFVILRNVRVAGTNEPLTPAGRTRRALMALLAPAGQI